VSVVDYTNALGLVSGDVVAMIGSGGKTSLLFRLAAENRDRRVLVSTTTKMLRPEPERTAGLTLLYGGEVDGKMTAPPIDQLRAACAAHELALLECDGSKGLPLKGWAAYEPVVPDFVTVTVGVLPLWALGQPVVPETIHRMELFCALTGAIPGEPVTAAHLAAVVEKPAGLFQKAQGRRVLFLNQRASEAGRDSVPYEIVEAAKRQGIAMLSGDIHRGIVREVRA